MTELVEFDEEEGFIEIIIPIKTEIILNYPSVELNKTFTHTIDNIAFGNLDINMMINIFKDGRAFSHFIEPWLATMYPLKHITGCKKYDFEDMHHSEILYDEKTFTRGGCKFYPSNMIGEGRKFDKTIFEEKAKKLIYIIVSNVNFPEIKVKFIKGTELLILYPKGEIHLKDFSKFFD